ncbi:MAG: histone deacetylase [Candidatus Aenigmatarchaeota archaeon]
MKIVFDKRCCEYIFYNHPESPERVLSIYELLKENYEFKKPSSTSEKNILIVHTKRLLSVIKSGRFIDFDTPNNKEMIRYALLSAGAAIEACKLAVKGKDAFSLMRPPGHHAGKDFAGGFCYLNNIAIAIATVAKNKKVAIIDIDGHWGNGTQDIFSGKQDIIYVSINQEGAYPGPHHNSENCRNFYIKPGSNGKVYLKLFYKCIDIVKFFGPDIIGISAGFDTFKEDPLLNLMLDIEDYKKIAQKISSLNTPLFAVLEGGYSNKLPYCIQSFLDGI